MSFYQNNSNNGYAKIHEEPLLSICLCDATSDAGKALRRENFHVGDFDGDGNEDLAVFVRPYVGNNADFNTISELRFYTNLRAMATGGNPNVLSVTPPSHLMPIVDHLDPDADYYNKSYAYVGDYDGDGISEIITTLRNTTSASYPWSELQLTSLKYGKYFESVLPETSSKPALNSVAYSIAKSRFCSPVNIDGGAAQELLYAQDAQYNSRVIGLRRDPVNGTFKSKLISHMSYPSFNYGINVGDFNGDGLTDVLTKKRDASEKWEIGYSNGKEFGTPISVDIGTPYYLRPTDYVPMPDETPIVTADFNGDGKTDIAHFYVTRKNIGGFQFNLANIEVYRSFGFHTFEKQNIEIEVDFNYGYILQWYSSKPQYLYNNYSLYLGDFNGDGKPDIMNRFGGAFNTTNQTNRGPNYLSFSPGAPHRLLTKVRNGLGLIETIDYMPLNKYHYHYEQDYPLYSAPSINAITTVNGPFYVVSHQETFNKRVDFIISNYKYKNLLLLKDGRGLIGFSEISKTSLFDGTTKLATTIQSYSNFLPPLYIPISSRVDKFVDDGTGLQPISSDVSEKATILIGTKGRYKMRPILTEEKNHLSGTTKATSYLTYDSYDNPTSIKEKIPGVEFLTRTITYAPIAQTLSLYPCRPARVIDSLSKNNSQTVTTTHITTYANGRVDNTKQLYGTPAQLTTQFTYYTAGTVKDKTISASGETSRTTSYTYDANHRFTTSETNALGQTTNSTYDPRFGTARTATRFDGLTTSYQYDGFGKLLNTNLPDGRVLTERWYWRPAQRLVDGIMRKVVNDPAATERYTDFNLLGKETEHGTKIWSGSGPADYTREILDYNAEGQLVRKISPRRSSSETAVEATNTYDKYGRLIKTCTQHDCSNIIYAYSGGNLVTSITDGGGRSKYSIKDAADKLLESKDESGVVTFSYDGWGNVVQTKANGQALSTVVYDNYNRKTSITETSSGTTSYTYTGYGAIKKQTDAGGKNTTFQYDALGRPVLTTIPEGNVIAEYYNLSGTGNSNQLKSVTRKNAQGQIEHSKTYSYDALGRLEKTQYHNGYFTAFTYDNLSRMATKRYISGVLARYSYQDGHIKEIKDASGTIHYRLEDINGLSAPTQEWRGNGKTTLQTYNYGNLTQTTTPGVQSYSLDYDFQRGLIKQRADGLVSVYDDFTYDRAGRLTKTHTGYTGRVPAILPPDQVQTYGTNAATAGNILNKSDVGLYSYGKPHQLYYTDNAAGSIPTIQQDITYSSYQRPLTITEGLNKAEFMYDGEGERSVMRMYRSSALQYQKEYYDDGSLIYRDASGQVTEKVTPVASDNGVAWIVRNAFGRTPFEPPVELLQTSGLEIIPDTAEATANANAGGGGETCCFSTEMYYPYTDHLGSIVALTDGTGAVVHRQAFDAWGRRRDVVTWKTDDRAVPPLKFRWLWGYTGHEQLDSFGLVNMNARLYDPKLGRMLSVDNYVSDAGSPLAYNRYSYANCNPISYVDPDGNHPVLIAMAIGAAISAATYTAQAAFAPGGLSRNFNIGDFLSTTAVGGIMGGVTYGVGKAFGSFVTTSVGMTFVKEAGRAVAHGFIGGGMSVSQGGDFWTGFLSNTVATGLSHGVALSGLKLGQVGGAFFAMGVGAGTSYVQGGNPWIGAGAALMSYRLNQLMSPDGDGNGDKGKKSNTLNEAVEGASWVSQGEAVAATAEMGLLEYSRAIQTGKNVANVKLASQAFGVLRSRFGIAGNFVTVASSVNDAYMYRSGQIGYNRLAYRTIGNALSIRGASLAGLRYGGATGALVGFGIGAAFYGGEVLYGLTQTFNLQLNQFSNTINYQFTSR